MNSIDAGAADIEIIFHRDQFEVKDNGKGFSSEDEVVNYFERFGSPHKGENNSDGDVIYGRFCYVGIVKFQEGKHS